MGLENLKSVFKEGFNDSPSTTDVTKMNSEFDSPIGKLLNQDGSQKRTTNAHPKERVS